MKFTTKFSSSSFVLLLTMSLMIAAGCGGSSSKPALPSAPPAPAITIATASTSDGMVNNDYSEHLQASGGRGPLAWSISAGTLPSGLTLDKQSGEIHGKPTTAGNFTYTVTATAGSSASKQLVTRIAAPLQISGTAGNGAVGQPYTAQLSVQGGFAPYVWFAPGMPTFLSVNSSGKITGTSPSTASSQFQMFVADSGSPQHVASMDLSIDFLNPACNTPLNIVTSTLPNAVQGGFYAVYIQTDQSCTGPLTWQVVNGRLPDGVIIYDGLGNGIAGGVNGAPRSVGTYTFTVQASDVLNLSPRTATRQFTINVLAPGDIGRNDTIANATPISNGYYRATISPLQDNGGEARPDVDYYKVVADAGSTVLVYVNADDFHTLDPAIRIVDGNGTPFTSCRNPGTSDGINFGGPPDPTPDAFDDACLNDDIDLGVNVNSQLEFLVPGPLGTQQTFYVQVLSVNGDASPEYVYVIQVEGAK